MASRTIDFLEADFHHFIFDDFGGVVTSPDPRPVCRSAPGRQAIAPKIRGKLEVRFIPAPTRVYCFGLRFLFDQHHSGAEHTVSLVRPAMSMIRQSANLPFNSANRASMNPWRSFAASYSAFSLRSPCAGFGDRLNDARSFHLVQSVQFGL